MAAHTLPWTPDTLAVALSRVTVKVPPSTSRVAVPFPHVISSFLLVNCSPSTYTSYICTMSDFESCVAIPLVSS